MKKEFTEDDCCGVCEFFDNGRCTAGKGYVMEEDGCEVFEPKNSGRVTK